MGEPRPLNSLVVVGLGYVGIPVAALFAKSGLKVTGLEVDPKKVDAINKGHYPIEGDEPGLPQLIAETVGKGTLKASLDPAVVRDADAVILCVQTPFDVATEEPRYEHLKSALVGVGKNMRRGTLVVVESTIAPTTMDRVVRPTLEQASGMKAGVDFLLGNCPERVMPGKLLHNLESYDRVLGGIDPATHARMKQLYSRIVKAPLDPVDMLTAEVVKAFENTYRDVEIALANEFARYCDVLGVDFFAVRELVNRVESRNLHLPGAGVGGHCIPKDTYLLAYGTKGRFHPDLMLMARKVNDAMPLYVADLTRKGLEKAGKAAKGATVAVLGYSYLGDSDDVRNTPADPYIETMRKAGATVKVHDPLVAQGVGPGPVQHDLGAVLKDADAVVVLTAHKQYKALDLRQLRQQVRTPVLVDGRRVFQREAAEAAGFTFEAVGY
ncbi:MAG: UDP-N-acetyl-D-mannosaminuronic acid dehydrogenase [Thermoplasmata archaeon]|jgi:UDP-N-acetyl-D-mannosaminuronic acid dehydrogenase|nr:UDP-N-acetyl-D-mannosaminuronic acid dehydrogenase [Thermoplasmata archaeon]